MFVRQSSKFTQKQNFGGLRCKEIQKQHKKTETQIECIIQCDQHDDYNDDAGKDDENENDDDDDYKEKKYYETPKEIKKKYI